MARASRLAVVVLLALALEPACARAEELPVDASAALRAELARAYSAGEYKLAVVAAEKLVASAPDDPELRYNLACVRARNGDRSGSIAALGKAAELGFRYAATLTADGDLESIRGEPGYASALARVRENSTRALVEFAKRAESAVLLEFPPPGPATGKPLPLVIALHGMGGNAENMARAWKQAAADTGAVLVAPQGLTAYAHGFGWGSVEEGELLVLRALEQARRDYAIDPARVVLAGFSQGGGFTYTVALRHPELFRGAVPICGYYDPLIAAPPKGTSAPLPRFAILVGGLDAEVGNNRDAAKRLHHQGAAVDLRVYPGVGHALPPERDAELASALRFALGE